MSQNRLGSRWLIVAALCGSLLLSQVASADTIWQRVGKKNAHATELLAKSTERVLWGLGDELDMFRVRTALVSLSRGEITEPDVVVLLQRLRRELRLSPGRDASALLKKALAGRLSHTYRAWAWMELAHVSVSKNELAHALLDLEHAYAEAWRVDDRAAIDVLSGWLLLRAHREREAQEAFRRLENRGAPARLVTQARVGLALAAAWRGDDRAVIELSERAYALQARRASVSGVDLFWEISLDDSTQAGAELILDWGKAEHARKLGHEELAQQQRWRVCERLFGDGEWVQLLGQIWQKACERQPVD